MAFYHTIRLVQRTKGGIRTLTIAKRVSVYEQPGKVSDIARKVLACPATLRVEIDEEDTQLYGYPAQERSYQSHVLHKDGRMFRFYGKSSNQAYLDPNFDTRIHMHQFRIA